MSGDFDRAVEIVLDSPAMLPHLDAFWAFIDGSMTEDEFRDAMSCDQGYTWEDRAVSLAARLAEVEQALRTVAQHPCYDVREWVGEVVPCGSCPSCIARAVLDKGEQV